MLYVALSGAESEHGAAGGKWMRGRGRTQGLHSHAGARIPRSKEFCIMETLGIMFAFVVLHAVLGEPLRKMDMLMPLFRSTSATLAGLFTGSDTMMATYQNRPTPGDRYGPDNLVDDIPHVCEGRSPELASVHFISPSASSQVQNSGAGLFNA